MRSIAVLAVILYHFSIAGFGGGFVGVDVFFVISGFLIGGILWRELTGTGTISLSRFFQRRLRRLAPAYVAMAAVTFVFAYLILLPFEFREFGKSLIAATVYLSNVFFYRGEGYFDTGAESKVLLHTWSLSVEEQFYIFLPPLLLLLKRNLSVLRIVLCLMFAASILGCIYYTRTAQTATFYLFHFRAWELLTGVLMAIWGHERARPWAHHALLSWAGLALVIGSIFLVQAGNSFPGVQALFPVAGTALLLLNGQDDNPVNRVLSSRGPVVIGLISYSLYIWHWPILTLSKYYRDGYSGPLETVGWMALVFVVSWLSWRFVETPLRHARGLRPVQIFGGAAIASACLVAAGGVLFLKGGLPGRYAPEVRTHIDATADFLQDWSRCTWPQTGPLVGLEVCPFGPEDQESKVLVWGDSHVRAFREGIALAAQEEDTAGIIVWNAGCPPLFGLIKTESAATQQEDAACLAALARMEQAIPKMAGIDTVLLIGRWAYYEQGAGVGLDAHNTIALSPHPDGGLSPADQSALYAQAVDKTLATLGQQFANVFVLRQVPEIAGYDSRIVARDLAHGRLQTGGPVTDLATVSMDDLARRTAGSDAPFDASAADGRITILDPRPRFCGETTCSALIDGQAVYFDNNHITNTGALIIRDLFRPIFATAP